MDDFIMTSEELYEALIGGCWEPDDAQAWVTEMREAKVGTLKADCWEKIGADEFIIFVA